MNHSKTGQRLTILNPDMFWFQLPTVKQSKKWPETLRSAALTRAVPLWIVFFGRWRSFRPFACPHWIEAGRTDHDGWVGLKENLFITDLVIIQRQYHVVQLGACWVGRDWGGDVNQQCTNPCTAQLARCPRPQSRPSQQAPSWTTGYCCYTLSLLHVCVVLLYYPF